MKNMLLLPLAALCFSGCGAQKEAVKPLHSDALKFDFGSGRVPNGYTKVLPQTPYSPDKGFGFDRGTQVSAHASKSANALTDGYVTSDKPFYFSVKVPEGNYHVKVTLGDDAGTSDAAIRAECRRMMVNRVQTEQGQHKTVEFTLHIRDSVIRGAGRNVRLKERERAYLHWDDKLTLEFNGEAPKVNAIEITPEQKEVVNVFLAGNSTVVDGANEPYSAWGQMIPSFFQPGKVAVGNYAESGETLSSFISARRFEKMLSLMKPGDYAFVEFGHNDQKQKGEGVGAFTTYKKNLEFFIDEVKKKGGIPVLVTSVQRRRFDAAGRIEETLGDYPAAVRQTAQERGVALIDLNATSKVMYEAWGPEASLKAFAHFPANTFPGQTREIADNTHFRPFGAYAVAQLIIKGIRDSRIGLAQLIKADVPAFDPALSENLSIDNKRKQGYLEALHKYDIPVNEARIVRCNGDEKASYRRIRQLLNSDTPPEGIFASVEKLALLTYQVCHDLDIKIPDSVKVICFSNLPTAPLLCPPLTTISQPAFEMGRQAATILLQHLDKKRVDIPNENITIKSVLVERGSTKK